MENDFYRISEVLPTILEEIHSKYSLYLKHWLTGEILACSQCLQPIKCSEIWGYSRLDLLYCEACIRASDEIAFEKHLREKETPKIFIGSDKRLYSATTSNLL